MSYLSADIRSKTAPIFRAMVGPERGGSGSRAWWLLAAVVLLSVITGPRLADAQGTDDANQVPPEAPANQVYEFNDSGAIVLSWDASEGAASYTVYYDDFFSTGCRLGSSGPSFCEELATDLTATTYTHTDPHATRNYYWVVACNNYGCSAIDSDAPAQLGGTPPEPLRPTRPTNSTTVEPSSCHGMRRRVLIPIRSITTTSSPRAAASAPAGRRSAKNSPPTSPPPPTPTPPPTPPATTTGSSPATTTAARLSTATLRRSSEAPHRRLRPTKPTNTTTVEPSSSVGMRRRGLIPIRSITTTSSPRAAASAPADQASAKNSPPTSPPPPTPTPPPTKSTTTTGSSPATTTAAHPSTPAPPHRSEAPHRGSGQPNLRTQQRQEPSSSAGTRRQAPPTTPSTTTTSSPRAAASAPADQASAKNSPPTSPPPPTPTPPPTTRNYYWVVACNNYGCSAIDSSTPVQLGGSPPEAPANQAYEFNDSGAIVLSWDASEGADSYTVYYDDFFSTGCRLGSSGPSFCEELATDLTATTYTHTDPRRHPQLLLGRRLQQLRLLGYRQRRSGAARRHTTGGSGQPGVRIQRQWSHRPVMGCVGGC